MDPRLTRILAAESFLERLGRRDRLAAVTPMIAQDPGAGFAKAAYAVGTLRAEHALERYREAGNVDARVMLCHARTRSYGMKPAARRALMLSAGDAILMGW